MNFLYIKRLAAYIFMTALLSLSTIESQADAVFSVATFGVYISNVHSDNNYFTNDCLNAAAKNPAVYLLCPLAFTLNTDGSFSLDFKSRTYLKEQGFSAKEVLNFETQGDYELSKSEKNL